MVDHCQSLSVTGRFLWVAVQAMFTSARSIHISKTSIPLASSNFRYSPKRHTFQTNSSKEQRERERTHFANRFNYAPQWRRVVLFLLRWWPQLQQQQYHHQFRGKEN
jgi:hypothetical protein